MYLESSWFNQNNSWFEGYAPGIHSTNNDIEAINQTIEIQNMFRERHDRAIILTIAQNDVVLNWSVDMALSGKAKFSYITLLDWTEAYRSNAQSIKSHELVIVESEGFSGNLKDTVPVVENKIESINWNDFDNHEFFLVNQI